MLRDTFPLPGVYLTQGHCGSYSNFVSQQHADVSFLASK